MEINVGLKHIVRGEKESALSCPIALAMQEQLDNPEIQVGAELFWLKDGEPFNDLPDIACDFIYAYDRGEPVYPISFEIPPVRSR